MLIFLVVLLTILVALLSFATYNLLRKNEELEDVINQFYGRTNATVKLMRHFDDRQIFEQDDEVGNVFKQLVECVDLLYAFVTEIRNGDNTPNEEEERSYDLPESLSVKGAPLEELGEPKSTQ